MNFIKKNIPTIELPLLKNFITYSAGSLFLKIITAGIGLITIRFLSPEEYGLLSLLQNFIWILPIVMNIGLRQAYGIDFFHLNHIERKKALNDTIGLYLTWATPILLLCIACSTFLNKLLFLNKASQFLLIISCLTSFNNFFFEFYLQLLRYRCKVKELTGMQLIAGIINVLLTCIFVYFFKFNIAGILLANFLSMLVVISIGFSAYKQKLCGDAFKIFSFSPKAFYYIKMGLPFIPSIIFTYILSSSNRWFLVRFATMHDVGIYSFADYVGQLFNLIVLYPLSSTYIPYIYTKFAEQRDNILAIDEWNKKIMYISMMLGLIAITFGFFIAKRIASLVIPPAYIPALSYIWFILVGQLFFMGSYFATCYMQFFKKIYIQLYFTIIGASINITLNYILTPMLGIQGCLIASICGFASYFFLIILGTILLKRNHEAIVNIQKQNSSITPL